MCKKLKFVDKSLFFVYGGLGNELGYPLENGWLLQVFATSSLYATVSHYLVFRQFEGSTELHWKRHCICQNKKMKKILMINKYENNFFIKKN